MKIYPSSINKRFWAFAIDCFTLWVGAFVILLCAIPFVDIFPEWLEFIFLFICIVAILFYIPIAETFFHGKTAGKIAMGIRVVRSDGSPASGIHCLQRYLMMPIDLAFTFGLGGLISAMITEKRQRIGDLIADTVVVNDNSHKLITQAFYDVKNSTNSPLEADLMNRINPYLSIDKSIPPLDLARMHRAAECDIARLRTHKAHPHLIEFMERLLSSIHIGMFRHGTHTLADFIKFTFRSIPRAVYEGRWAIMASLAVVIISYAIGIYSQATDPGFFERLYGPYYTQMTIDNIESGDPMGVYSNMRPFPMFFDIFFNNLLVTLRLYAMGVFVLIGPIMFLLNNFVSFAAFDMFFAQHGHIAAALISPNEHGVLELWSIIMAGGASILLGTGWLFPGRLTRLQALARSARHSMLIMVSTIPMLLVAAFIESFITRHTEWSTPVKLSIIIISFIIIFVYYVMLPIRAKRQ